MRRLPGGESLMSEDVADRPTKSGFVALIGRPNVGKSTLLNQLIGQKIAAVSDKPQTTRWRIRGILTRPEGQIIFVDTPGIHKPIHRMNERMMSAVEAAIADVDLLLLMIDVTEPFGGGDRFVLEMVKRAEKPAFLLLNKIDRLADKRQLLPLIDLYRREYDFKEYIPLSALTGENVDLLLRRLFEHLPEGPLYYPEGEITDQPERLLVAEIVREKILMITRDEIPYVTAVYTESFKEEGNLLRIHCVILVERESQKPIIIGKGGERLKKIGTLARQEIEFLFGKKVFLELYVKVREKWRENDALLTQLGLER
ncbi:MAG: GTPase Era [Blastocatellia bacterium]|nr:GTPase Era [Blastocatellia bacterium]MCS7156896.1 GTPase Era [Blastocatellia bacterium]MCX7752095.1 GTPase Era [Blastocatellia bacterium]MDW8167588.1 GTPase Era [Acidobacteriota bacterium]MDW8256188.1 GTPase Era [Acidobacteriota bacterium]